MANKFFSAATYRTSGSVAVSQSLFTIENGAGGTPIYIRRLNTQMDAVAVLTAPMPIIKTSRTTILPTGGYIVSKSQYDTSVSSSSAVIVRSTAAGDGTASLALIATSSVVIWQQYGMRMHTLVGQVLGNDNNSLPAIVETENFVLSESQALMVQVVAAVNTSNPITNQWFVECVWEE